MLISDKVEDCSLTVLDLLFLFSIFGLCHSTPKKLTVKPAFNSLEVYRGGMQERVMKIHLFSPLMNVSSCFSTFPSLHSKQLEDNFFANSFRSFMDNIYRSCVQIFSSPRPK